MIWDKGNLKRSMFFRVIIPPDATHTNLIIGGGNPMVTNTPHDIAINKARERGAKLIVIDPRVTAPGTNRMSIKHHQHPRMVCMQEASIIIAHNNHIHGQFAVNTESIAVPVFNIIA